MKKMALAVFIILFAACRKSGTPHITVNEDTTKGVRTIIVPKYVSPDKPDYRDTIWGTYNGFMHRVDSFSGDNYESSCEFGISKYNDSGLQAGGDYFHFPYAYHNATSFTVYNGSAYIYLNSLDHYYKVHYHTGSRTQYTDYYGNRIR